jgi:hypothetical protein
VTLDVLGIIAGRQLLVVGSLANIARFYFKSIQMRK